MTPLTIVGMGHETSSFFFEFSRLGLSSCCVDGSSDCLDGFFHTRLLPFLLLFLGLNLDGSIELAFTNVGDVCVVFEVLVVVNLLGFTIVHELISFDVSYDDCVSNLISSCNILFINFTEFNSSSAA